MFDESKWREWQYKWWKLKYHTHMDLKYSKLADLLVKEFAFFYKLKKIYFFYKLKNVRNKKI